MSSVHKIKGKKNWICFYSDRTGRRRAKSTMTVDKREAVRVCSEIQKLEDRARNNRLTPDNARKVIENTVAEIMESLGSPLETSTVEDHFAAWLKNSEMELSSTSYARYAGIARQFLEFIGPKAKGSLNTLSSKEIEAFRNDLHGRLSPRSVNLSLKTIRVCLQKAVRAGKIDKNPASMVGTVATGDSAGRRAFTLDELKKIIAAAGPDWKTAILAGIYTGLRLGDISSLTFQNIDMVNAELTIKTQKTGRTQIIPLAPPLLKHIEALASQDDPKAPLMPSLHGLRIGQLSNAFREILASVGLVEERNHRKNKSGRAVKRASSDISFHSLRHTATSLLKNAGVSDVVARDIIGHDSAAISANYTHIQQSTKREAVNKMPDVTAVEKQG